MLLVCLYSWLMLLLLYLVLLVKHFSYTYVCLELTLIIPSILSTMPLSYLLFLRTYFCYTYVFSDVTFYLPSLTPILLFIYITTVCMYFWPAPFPRCHQSALSSCQSLQSTPHFVTHITFATHCCVRWLKLIAPTPTLTTPPQHLAAVEGIQTLVMPSPMPVLHAVNVRRRLDQREDSASRLQK